MTMQGLGFVDEVDQDDVDAIVAVARLRLALVPAFAVLAGKGATEPRRGSGLRVRAFQSILQVGGWPGLNWVAGAGCCVPVRCLDSTSVVGTTQAARQGVAVNAVFGFVGVLLGSLTTSILTIYKERITGRRETAARDEQFGRDRQASRDAFQHESVLALQTAVTDVIKAAYDEMDRLLAQLDRTGPRAGRPVRLVGPAQRRASTGSTSPLGRTSAESPENITLTRKLTSSCHMVTGEDSTSPPTTEQSRNRDTPRWTDSAPTVMASGR
ncbi:hypothetical protein EDD99_5426 [Streptomyces sp. 846.5]|nr:hypothetical protein EDD99_5426 [Streptomyces sp. 846.5]